jgi:flagellar basal body-associated protein FliL
MNDLFSWWHGSNLQISIVIGLVLCALGTFVSLALCSDKRSDAERDYDDEQQAKAVRRVSSANYWSAQ